MGLKISRYIKKEGIVKAVQFNGNSNKGDVEAFFGRRLRAELESETAYVAGEGAPIFSLWGPGYPPIYKGDWIVKGNGGHYFILSEEVFASVYEKI